MECVQFRCALWSMERHGDGKKRARPCLNKGSPVLAFTRSFELNQAWQSVLVSSISPQQLDKRVPQ